MGSFQPTRNAPLHGAHKVVLSLIVTVVLAALLASCGDSKSPTAPTPTIPTVSGNYSGTLNYTFPELQVSLTCPASTTVTHSGSAVSIAPLTVGGQCTQYFSSIPIGQVTIDTTGAFTGNNTGTYTEPSCGVYNYSASGGFYARELRLSMIATSTGCWNFTFTATLSR